MISYSNHVISEEKQNIRNLNQWGHSISHIDTHVLTSHAGTGLLSLSLLLFAGRTMQLSESYI